MVSKDYKLSVRRECALLTLTRSNLYYQPKGESTENLRFMAIIDKQFLETPSELIKGKCVTAERRSRP